MSATFLKHFNSITDPRIERCKKHALIDILLLAISAVLSGAEGWEDKLISKGIYPTARSL